MAYTPGGTAYHGTQHLTREQFIHRLVCAGWTQVEAESEWSEIDDEPEEDWEGQL